MTTTNRPRLDMLCGGRAVRIIVPDHRIDQTCRIDDADRAVRSLHLHRFLGAEDADRMLIEIHDRLMMHEAISSMGGRSMADQAKEGGG